MLDIKTRLNSIVKSSETDLTEELLTGNTPILLKGLVKDWPAVKAAKTSDRAIVDYLKSFDAGKRVRVFCTPPELQGRYFYNSELTGFNFTVATQTSASLLDELIELQGSSEPRSKYMGSTAVDAVMPGFRQENDLVPLTDKPLVKIWVGNQSRIAAHFDVTDNIACCVAGKRTFTLFPPDQVENLYIGPIDFTPAGQPASLVDFHAPDFTRFPKFIEALEHAMVAELEPGDAIFIPSMWWHHVEGKSKFNVLVNYWWRQIEHFAGNPMDALEHAILAIRDLPEPQRKIWQAQFEHYVFAPQSQSHIPNNAKGILNPLDETTARTLRTNLLNKLNR